MKINWLGIAVYLVIYAALIVMVSYVPFLSVILCMLVAVSAARYLTGGELTQSKKTEEPKYDQYDRRVW